MADSHEMSDMDSGGGSPAQRETETAQIDTVLVMDPEVHARDADLDWKREEEERKENLGEFIASAAKSSHKLDLKEGFYTEPAEGPKHPTTYEADIEEHRTGGYRSHQPMRSHSHHHHKHRHHHHHHHGKRRSSTGAPPPNFTPCLSSVSERSEKGSEVPIKKDSVDSVALSASAVSQVSTTSSTTEPAASFYVGDKPSLSDEVTDETSKSPETGEAQDEDVKFFVGYDEEADAKEAEPSPSKKKHRHHPRPFSEKDLARRRHLGSEVKLADARNRQRQAGVVIEGDDELDEMDKDDLASHRFGDAKGRGRKKVSAKSAMASLIYFGKTDKPSKKKVAKKPKFDHSPHELFVELDELNVGADQDWKWSEKARWIKFEEDVEEGAERWGRPHVASLSFHCLIELRRCLEKGAVIMDLVADDLTSIVNHVVDQFVITEQLEADNRGAVLQALLLKHRHVGEEKPFLRRNLTQLNLLRRSSSSHRGSTTSRRNSEPSRKGSSSSLKAMSPSKNKSETDSFEGKYVKLEEQMQTNGEVNAEKDPKENGNGFYNIGKVPEIEIIDTDVDRKRDHFKIDLDTFDDEKKEVTLSEADKEGISQSFSHASALDTMDQTEKRKDRDILKCIPKDAEATTVLVGAVDFLTQPIMAFVRLAEGRYLGNLTEVNLPVRFIFILMGPKSSSMDYYEIGRSISTLMANRSFHDIAYKAENHQDIIDAINEFLDNSIVLPPGEWNKETLLPIVEMANREVQARKKRRAKRLGLPPPDKRKPMVEEDPFGDPLKRTGRPFRGLINDVKRRYPKYLSDITDALNLQCLATFFFVYFACLSPAITFGGLLSEKTEKWMGVSEMLIGVSVCGVIMALFSGQPILIVGATGPMLVFEEALYQICDSLGLDFIAFRAWCGFWVTIIATMLVGFEGSFMVRYFTRFIQEIFALLISLIFIIETFIKLSKIFERHPLLAYYPPLITPNSSSLSDGVTHALHYMSSFSPLPSGVTDDPFDSSNLSLRDTNITDLPTTPPSYDPLEHIHPNTALLSLILCFGTFFIAHFLKQFRNSKFLGRSIRRALGDFGIPIAIIIMVLVDYLIKDTYTEKLDVPDGLSPTAGHMRGWVINPLGTQDEKLPIWAFFAAVVPALLVFILIFMESEITSMIVNKKDRKLKKGSGYHLDLILIGAFASLCGILGLPFVCAATVRSVTHVSALSVFSRTNAPGEKPHLEEVKEQRLTGFAVHVVIGVSVLMGPILRQVPLAVLFGVFLYMGVASMNGIQMLDRIKMLFMPVKHHPPVGYVRRVRTFRMHLFTFIQLLAIAALWAIKSTQAALAFPFILILLVPVRLVLLKYMFTEKELSVLDRDEEGGDEDDEEEEPDFYEQAHMPM